MKVLMIRCPKTGQAISTGIETDEYSLDQFPDVRSRTRCPACRREHAWWTHGAWLSDRAERLPTPFSQQPKLDKAG